MQGMEEGWGVGAAHPDAILRVRDSLSKTAECVSNSTASPPCVSLGAAADGGGCCGWAVSTDGPGARSWKDGMTANSSSETIMMQGSTSSCVKQGRIVRL